MALELDQALCRASLEEQPARDMREIDVERLERPRIRARPCQRDLRTLRRRDDDYAQLLAGRSGAGAAKGEMGIVGRRRGVGEGASREENEGDGRNSPPRDGEDVRVLSPRIAFARTLMTKPVVADKSTP